MCIYEQTRKMRMREARQEEINMENVLQNQEGRENRRVQIYERVPIIQLTN